MEDHDKNAWSPYLAGCLTGLLVILSVWVSGKYLGASTTFVRSTGMIEKIVAPERTTAMQCFEKHKPEIDWQWMFVLGIFFGALISAVSSKTFRWKGVPDMWQKRFGPSRLKRAALAFFGAFIAIIGARIAGGCPSGHGLSGTLQLSLSGIVTLICFFAGGIPVAWLLYRKVGE